MTYQISLLRRTCLEWLSSHLNCLHWNIVQRGWAPTFIYEPYLLEISRWERGKDGFPEHRGIGSAVPSWGLFTCWTKKLLNSWGLSLWIGKFNLVVQTGYVHLSVIRKRKISHAPSEFSTKENTFFSAFWGMENVRNEPGFREFEEAHGIFFLQL